MPLTETVRFADRRAAGRELARALGGLATEDPVVLGLARGGVPVAFEVARALDAPLDVLVACKIGAPGNPELGIGAIAEGGIRALNRDVIRELPIGPAELNAAAARTLAEVEARTRRYRSGRDPIDLTGRSAIIVDDGLATGGTARVALRAARVRGPQRLVLAVPVGSRQAIRSLRSEADELICLLDPEPLQAVGFWYEDFTQTSDAEVQRLLAGAPGEPQATGGGTRREVRVPIDAELAIVGDLAVPSGACGLVIFAHGSGSSRLSPRNRQVAETLNERGLATLLLDLLTHDEEQDRANVFDIGRLAARLAAATDWARHERPLAGLPIGYFGASTGAAAALSAAAAHDGRIGAVVSRGGRPDLASAQLSRVTAPVLLIVGGEDHEVRRLNEESRLLLGGPSELAVVPGASHLFEEPGALSQVSQLAGAWFGRHLRGETATTR